MQVLLCLAPARLAAFCANQVEHLCNKMIGMGPGARLTGNWLAQAVYNLCNEEHTACNAGITAEVLSSKLAWPLMSL